jgi:hypothetical protein
MAKHLQVISDPSPSPFGTDPNSNFIVTTPPANSTSYTSSSKSKPRTKSQSRVTKRSKKKTDTPPTSPPGRSPEATTFPDLLQAPAQMQQQAQQGAQIMGPSVIQDQTFPYSPPAQSSSYNQSMQYMPPNPQPYQSMAPMQSNYMSYPSGQEYTGPGGHQILYEQPQHVVNYSSRIEDVTIGHNPRL